MEKLKKLLVKKGWSSRDVEKTIRVLGRAHEKKSQKIILLDKLVLWVGLLLVILGNFIVSVVLVPFLLILSGIWLYVSLLFIAASFGFVVNVVAMYIEKIEREHVLIMGVLMPAIALITVYIITFLANRLEVLLQLGTPLHNPTMIALVYTVGFMMPYMFTRLRHP